MNPTGTWPTAGDSADPFARELGPAVGHRDYLNAGGDLEESAYIELRDDFLVELAELRAGRKVDPAPLASMAKALRLDLGRRAEHPKNPLVAARAPTDEMLARIATDLVPAGTSEALDRYLGPLADELDLADPRHAGVARAALAAFCFTRPDGASRADGTTSIHGRNPFEQWCRRKPIPPVDVRADVRAVARAPLGVWSLEARVGDRWRVVDRLGLGTHTHPTEPVLLPTVAAPWREPRPGDTLVARLFPAPEGWVGLCAIALPTAPPPQRLRTWLTLALWESRLLDRRLTVEGLLRARGEALCRRVMEWAWLHGDDDPYRDPFLYDLEYDDNTEDLVHYTGLAHETGGPVLELGCGTGRLTLAIAETGAEVEGVDLSPAMLRGLDRRLADHPELAARVQTRQGDFRQITADRSYALVIWPFNALHHCRNIDEVRTVLERIRALLKPGGRLAIDCYLPALELYDRDPAERVEPRTFTHPVTGERLESWEQGWWDPQLQVHHVLYVYRREDGTTHPTHLQLRMYQHDELRTALGETGWRVVREAQDFEGTPVGDEALKWVLVLERDDA